MQMTGAVASGETPTTDEQTDGLAAANQMLDDWCAEAFMVHAEKRTTHTMVSGTNPHTIGSGGTFSTDRPVKIDRAGVIVAGETSETEIYVARIIDEYAAIADKAAAGSLPSFLYYEAAFPLGQIFLNPVPNTGNTLVLYRWVPFTSIATAGTTVTLPPGYESMFDANLAIYLAARNIGVLNAATAKLAKDSKERIKPLNLRMPILRNDAAGIDGESSGKYNIRTNSW